MDKVARELEADSEAPGPVLSKVEDMLRIINDLGGVQSAQWQGTKRE